MLPSPARMTATTPHNPTAKKVYFVSLGCPKNQVDTEIMLGVVRDQGHVLVDTAEEADTLVVNTCGFIEEAKQESVETILELAQAKAAGQGKRLVVAGCLSQRYPEELAKEMPEVDNFLGSADMLGLAQVLSGGAQRMGVSPLSRRAYLYDHTTPRQVSGRTHSAYLKIAEGCDRPCAFCIIPKLRGPQRSRTIESIAAEAEMLVSGGARELCLVAQDLTTYGTDIDGKPDLEQLLDRLCQVKDLRWIRLHYAFPTTVTDGLIKQIASEPVELEITPQQAYDVALKLVNRRKWLIIDERPPTPPRTTTRTSTRTMTPTTTTTSTMTWISVTSPRPSSPRRGRTPRPHSSAGPRATSTTTRTATSNT